jgi:predicted aspartyl protease
MNAFFSDDSYYELERQEGLLYVTLRAIYVGSASEGAKLRFVLDTGAFMTVLSRGTAIDCGFDQLPATETTLTGFGGTVKVDFVRIPGLLVLDKLFTDVPVLIPHDKYRVDETTGEKKQMQEVIGLNVLEYYNYFIDTENDRLYLRVNPKPRFYKQALASGQVFG